MIVFRADASSTIGGGHVYRCLTLAHAIKQQDASQTIVFVCHLGQGHMGDVIQAQGFELIDIEQPLSSSEMRQVLLQQQNSHTIDWLIIDHYQINIHYQKQLHPLVRNLMVIDDLANRGHHCDLLFDQSLNRHPSDYQPWLTNSNCGVICGSQFALLRDEFSALKPQAILKRKSFKQINNVLIAISATDPDNISGQIISQLINLPVNSASKNWHYTLVLTSKAQHLAAIKEQVKLSTLNITLALDVTNMAELMLNHDIAIAAAGGAMLERCAMGLPSIIIGVVDNQTHIINALAKQQIAIAVMDKSELADKLNSVLINLETIDHQAYQHIANNAFKTCRGDGAAYVAVQLQTKNHQHNDYLQRVTSAHCKLIFDWQQHPKTRAFARNPNPPTWDEHQHWFANTLASSDNNSEINFYLLMHKGQSAGFVRLNAKTLAFEHGEKGPQTIVGKEVSIALNPDCHSKGLGVTALKLLTELHRDSKLLAFIDENNIASVKAFERAGFGLVSQTVEGNWYQYKKS